MPANKTTTAKTRNVKAAKPAAKPATEAPTVSLAERVATERASALALFRKAEQAAVSIPIKPLSAFRRTYVRDVTAHAIGRKPSPRQAAALTIAALSGGAKLADKATFSRKFERAGVTYAIENGALSDAISAGLCTYDAKSEIITITNAAELASQIGAVSLN